MSTLQMLSYKQNEVRMVMQDDGPWWVLADVCKVLGLTTPARVAERLDADEKGMSLVHTPGGSQQMTIINESGLYSVILRSDKPEAKAFKRWITHEVLPSIRRTGGYGQNLPIDALNQLTAYTQVLTQSIQALSQEVADLKTGRDSRQALQSPGQAPEETMTDTDGYMDSMEIARILGRDHNNVLKSIRNVSEQARADGIPVDEYFSVAYRRCGNNVRHRYYRVSEAGISLFCQSLKNWTLAEKLRSVSRANSDCQNSTEN